MLVFVHMFEFPAFWDHSHNSLQRSSASQVVGWIIAGRALRGIGRGQDASQGVGLVGDYNGKLPCIMNTDNGTEEGLW